MATKYDREHAKYAEVLRRVEHAGRFTIPCGGSVSDARALRTRFYTYFKQLERQEKMGNEEARELLKIRDKIVLSAYGNGELILSYREKALTMDYIDASLARDVEYTSISDKALGSELEEVSVEMMKEKVEGLQELKTKKYGPKARTPEEQAEWDRKIAEDGHFI